ncbi:CTP synthase [Christensenellaceae bacterium OttesenSCG-928-L17]|nr:CTP synthase [Christensenellaceae bacterium OttesenSCG-928-L17]
MAKIICITGGVASALGKGITAASLGRLLKARGFCVSICKLDPYLNIDPGTMNPYQHGEVYVTIDGAETDLDIGHYERFIDENLTRANNATAGQVYAAVIERERRGGYNGGTVQVIPHITEEIKSRIAHVEAESKADVLLVEIGGTVGDIESLPFLEAIRQLYMEREPGSCCFVHVTLVPYIAAAGELKSKPTQHSVKELLSIGIQPDILVCRSERPIPEEMRRKISLFCNVPPSYVIENLDADSLYQVPLMLEQAGLCAAALRKLQLPERPANLAAWEALVTKEVAPRHACEIAIVGKYVALHDAYLSIAEALRHGGIATNTRVRLRYVDAEEMERGGASTILQGVDGILVPGGFGERGLEGKIAAIQFARQENIPFFGICLGMQMMVVEFARHVLGYAGAHSTEVMSDTPYPVVDLMPDQQQHVDGDTGELRLGGTLRLGAYRCALEKGSLAQKLYDADMVDERHRHRYEINNDYRNALSEGGLVATGINPERNLVEIFELPGHAFFLGVQFHPEFQSRPDHAHPLFVGFVKEAINHRRGNI